MLYISLQVLYIMYIGLQVQQICVNLSVGTLYFVFRSASRVNFLYYSAGIVYCVYRSAEQCIVYIGL